MTGLGNRSKYVLSFTLPLLYPQAKILLLNRYQILCVRVFKKKTHAAQEKCNSEFGQLLYRAV
jgi:hypothetical protein